MRSKPIFKISYTIALIVLIAPLIEGLDFESSSLSKVLGSKPIDYTRRSSQIDNHLDDLSYLSDESETWSGSTYIISSPDYTEHYKGYPSTTPISWKVGDSELSLWIEMGNNNGLSAQRVKYAEVEAGNDVNLTVYSPKGGETLVYDFLESDSGLSGSISKIDLPPGESAGQYTADLVGRHYLFLGYDNDISNGVILDVIEH